MVYSSDQLTERLNRVRTLLDSPEFFQKSDETSLWRPVFAEMITAVNELLSQAQQQNHRIDFLKGVGVHGKVQDITSLVSWINQRLPEVTTDLPGQLVDNRLNRYFGQGSGYFANGSFFSCDYDDEVAFFLDDQRIYLNQQIRRAVDEVQQKLQTPDTLPLISL